MAVRERCKSQRSQSPNQQNECETRLARATTSRFIRRAHCLISFVQAIRAINNEFQSIAGPFGPFAAWPEQKRRSSDGGSALRAAMQCGSDQTGIKRNVDHRIAMRADKHPAAQMLRAIHQINLLNSDGRQFTCTLWAFPACHSFFPSLDGF
jgi:hypothetical protein